MTPSPRPLSLHPRKKPRHYRRKHGSIGLQEIATRRTGIVSIYWPAIGEPIRTSAALQFTNWGACPSIPLCIETALTSRLQWKRNWKTGSGNSVEVCPIGRRFGRWRVNAGILRTNYHKVVTNHELAESELNASKWLYNFSASYQLGKAIEIYGGHSRGLEEAGVAPASATNRYEVLPPAAARQFEM